MFTYLSETARIWALSVLFAPAPARAPDPPAAAAAAHFTVAVPADATLLIQGRPTRQTGPRRNFVSPPLQSGTTYQYVLTVRWTENDRPVEQTVELAVRAGDRQSVLVSAAPANGARR
jgi:uncharacterized protein (TIGR03000 family)